MGLNHDPDSNRSPAAGKTTIGPLLAKKLERCAVLDVDVLRAMVVQPHVAPWRGEAGRQQLALGARNACSLARTFAANEFHVVMLDVLTDETARVYQAELATLAYRIVLLLPTLTTVLQRNRDRGQFLTDEEVGLLYEWQRALTLYDQQIDNSDLSVEAVVAMLRQGWPAA